MNPEGNSEGYALEKAERRRELMESIALGSRGFRTYLTATLLLIGAEAIEGVRGYDELKPQYTDSKFMTGPLKFVEDLKDLQNLLHKQSKLESPDGDTSLMVITKAGQTLRSIAYDHIILPDMKAAGAGLHINGSIVEVSVYITAKQLGRLNNLEGVGIDDPLPEGLKITVD